MFLSAPVILAPRSIAFPDSQADYKALKRRWDYGNELSGYSAHAGLSQVNRKATSVDFRRESVGMELPMASNECEPSTASFLKLSSDKAFSITSSIGNMRVFQAAKITVPSYEAAEGACWILRLMPLL